MASGAADTTFAPQACRLTASDGPMVAEIGRMERLDADLAAILAHIGAAPATASHRRINRTDHVPPTIFSAGVAGWQREVHARDVAMQGHDAGGLRLRRQTRA